MDGFLQLPTINDVKIQLENILKKYKPRCMEKLNGTCASIWLYSSCINIDTKHSRAFVDCPYYALKMDIKCNFSSGQWEIDESTFMNHCLINKLRLTYVVDYIIGSFINPIFIFLLLTSLYKISVYSEISKDFNWRIFGWYINGLNTRIVVDMIFCYIKKSLTSENICVIIRFFQIYLDYLIQTCQIGLYFYVYFIINEMNIQMRVIKSVIVRFTYLAPCLMVSISLVVDMYADDKYNYFECETDIRNSKVLETYGIFFAVTTFLMVILRIVILLLVRRNKSLKKSNFGLYRLEYDVVGQKKEVPKREIHRMCYTLNCMLPFIIIKEGIFFMYLFVNNNKILNATDYIYICITPAIPYINALPVFIITWCNKNLKIRMQALDDWYIEVNNEQNTAQQEEDFKMALKETDN